MFPIAGCSIDTNPGPAMAALMKLSFDEEHRSAICQLGKAMFGQLEGALSNKVPSLHGSKVLREKKGSHCQKRGVGGGHKQTCGKITCPSPGFSIEISSHCN